jgi:hypothetical protein
VDDAAQNVEVLRRLMTRLGYEVVISAYSGTVRRPALSSTADVYDALTTERSYKTALTPDHAVRELRDEAARGWKFDTIVEEFAALAARGDFAELSLGNRINAPRIQQRRTSI